jgi:hypothetical protein
VYLFVLTADTAAEYRAWGFGDFLSQVAADNYRTMLVARETENTGVNTSEWLGRITATISTTSSTYAMYLARAYTGTGGSLGGQSVNLLADNSKGSANALTGVMQYPNGPDGGLYLSPVWIGESGQTLRGRMRGLWCPLHPVTAFSDGDTVSGAGAYAGKTFLALKTVSGAGTSGVAFLETSDTVESN